MSARLFDRCDLADWEANFEAAVTALHIPALRGCVPEYMQFHVLDWTEIYREAA